MGAIVFQVIDKADKAIREAAEKLIRDRLQAK